ncbi:SDR family oxidoreductase [Ferrimonas senticii]|uniref:SDR family oxidoreductase n=1 Tax=Ferrimonas senticii TaxID=394566 RepID=UPI000400F0D8|nr:SDR family oxidoreductase [Ferrimonas senticii]
MNYLITGATGFLGRFLLARLVQRPGNLFCLVSSERSKQRLAEIGQQLGVESDRLIAINGDITKTDLGITPNQQQQLQGQIDHLIHLAAIYDLNASAEEQINANVEGTKQVIAVASKLQVRCLHHVSSIAAAGFYRGTFDERMFAEAEQLDHPYFLTKHMAEHAVREQTAVPYRIYRPGMVVGDSRTGEADKPDGPYLFFKLLQSLRNNLPKWVPLLGFEGGRLNIVPVDFVTDAMDHLIHLEGQDGQCFHLTDPNPLRSGEVLNLFADAAHAPRMAMRLNTRLFNFIPRNYLQLLSHYPPAKRLFQGVMAELGVPETALKMVNYPTRFDSRATHNLLKPAGIECPPLASYATTLWDYWERNLDPDLHKDRSLCQRLCGHNVLITGASSGIGLATAKRLAHCSKANFLIVARDCEQLEQAKQELLALGAESVHAYCTDLTNAEQTEELLAQIKAEHGAVHLLINNAGRSIRRAVTDSKDRFHDFERTMALNYFGALRLILGVLDGMEHHHRGHVINISSIGVLTNAPRFSAYVASKAALDAFSRCAASEYSDMNIRFTTINMPLVRTPMIAPTKMYDDVPTLTPEQAAELVVDAIIHQPKRIATKLGILGAVLHAVAPKMAELVMNGAFRMFPDSPQAQRDNALADQQQQIQLAALLRGIYF